VARRTITRPVQAAGEQHRAVDESEFDVLLERGAFALNWRANGHRYGIGREIDDWLDEGRTVVVNGSREHLPLARATYPQLEAVHVSAPVALLRERLSGRAREPMEQVHARLRRTLPVTGAALEIDNTGALENAGDQLLRFLVPDN
jgi:ribose 1,5-bisphosphokinase